MQKKTQLVWGRWGGVLAVVVATALTALGWARPVAAAAPVGQVGDVVFQDDFSQGMSQWQVTRGAASIWQVVGGKLQGLVPGGNTISELIPQADFWNPGWRNYEFELDMMSQAGSDKNFGWGFQDKDNWYDIHFVGSSFLEWARVKDKGVLWFRDKNYAWTANVWHHLKLKTAGGQLTLWIDGNLIDTVTETNYNENPGEIALRVSTGVSYPTQVQFDNVIVRLVADPRGVDLAVPAVRQDDSAGTTVTAAVMLLRFYGFGQLADGQVLTSASLKAWLAVQPDGLLGSGSVNWVAVGRLARELREKFSTVAQPLPQLQFGYQGWKDWAQEGIGKVKAELDQGRPVILEVPGQFVVGRGYTPKATDWLIRDPASSADLLSQLNQPALSARTFQTSLDTNLLDLSYWVVAVRRGLRVKVWDEQHQLVPSGWISQEVPGSDWVIATWVHPPSGSFRLEVARATGDEAQDGGIFPTATLPTLVPFELQVFYYDAKAQVTAWRKPASLGVVALRWQLTTGDVVGGGAPKLEADFTWQDWRTSLREVAVGKSLPRVVAARLDQVAQLAQASDSRFNQRYSKWVKAVLEQAGQTWQGLINAPEIRHLQTQLTPWLEGN